MFVNAPGKTQEYIEIDNYIETESNPSIKDVCEIVIIVLLY